MVVLLIRRYSRKVNWSTRPLLGAAPKGRECKLERIATSKRHEPRSEKSVPGGACGLRSTTIRVPHPEKKEEKVGSRSQRRVPP